MTKETLSQQLTRAYEQAAQAYNDALESDRFQQVKDGHTKFAEGFANDKYRQSAETQIYALRSRALSAIEAERAETERRMTEAPDTDTANYITTIRGRKDLTPAEVDAALKRYPSYAAQKAIRAAAIESGLTRYDVPTEQERYIAQLDRKAKSVDAAFTSTRISEGAARQGMTAAALGDMETDTTASNGAWLHNMFRAAQSREKADSTPAAYFGQDGYVHIGTKTQTLDAYMRANPGATVDGIADPFNVFPGK